MTLFAHAAPTGEPQAALQFVSILPGSARLSMVERGANRDFSQVHRRRDFLPVPGGPVHLAGPMIARCRRQWATSAAEVAGSAGSVGKPRGERCVPFLCVEEGEVPLNFRCG